MLKFIQQGKTEGVINLDLSEESILIYIGMFKDVLTKTDIPMKARMDLGKLFFYGLLGKPMNDTK